ncbi:MAG: hypothetical protein FJ221_01175 [Lentisphaerae bacterium]|nr:hypothetical protein [Lentisphaerota bacterium]
MRLDLRRMPMNELAQLLKDIAHELQSRGRGGQGGNFGGHGGQPATNYGRTGYGQPAAFGQGGQGGGGYGGNSRFGGGGGGGGNFQPRGGQGGGFRRHGGRRQDFRQQQQRQPVEPPAPIDDPPADRPEPGNEA